MKLVPTSQPVRRRRKDSRPNILFIVMDATRAQNLSMYGYGRKTTPHLERFSQQAVVYEQAISPAGWSLPAHASLFTGLYATRHGADDQHKYLDSEYATMAQVLKSQGYSTIAFCNNPYVGPVTGLQRGFDHFNQDRNGARRPLMRKLERFSGKMKRGVSKVLGETDSGARQINYQAINMLRRLSGDENPFFMFIHYEDTHAPYRLPYNYVRYLPNGVSRREALRVNQDPWKYLIDPFSMDADDFEILTALYDSAITYTDSRIAQVLDCLEKLEMLDNTMVIITADHGENLGDHQLMAHKYCLYDTLLHVPLMIRYPNGTLTPRRVTHQVQTLDVLPTILSLLGDTSSTLYPSLQGYDLLSFDRHSFAIAEQSRPDLTNFHKRFPGVDVSRFDRALKMIRTDRYKYIWGSDGQHELYDLQVDPEEKHNLIRALPDIADNLDWRLSEWSSSFSAAVPSDEVPEFDNQVKVRLRDLGYLE